MLCHVNTVQLIKTSPFAKHLCHSLNQISSKHIRVDISSNEATNSQTDVDAYSQEWFDDDFGLSRTSKEAEELRLQQLQIEQEIQQLQAQQQQEQVPYYYLREIPNKPPPPYTPPGKAPSEKPSTEADITAIMTRAVKILTDELNSDKEISTLEPPSEFFSSDDNKSVKCYKVFLFDLAKQIISEILNSEKDEEKLPWMRTNERLSKFKCKRIDRTFESLNEYVIKKVLILFGFRQKVGKESLIVRWSRKKRDHVDELLVSESQEEESQWTRYDKDQVTVKNEVTTAILDTLIDDTVQVLVSIFNKKKILV